MSYEIAIEAGKVREFARATQSRHPDHHGSAPVIPATFLTTARLVWEPRDQAPIPRLGFDVARSLHAEEEYVFHGPPPSAGTILSVETRIHDTFEKQGARGGRLRFAVVVNEFRDASGALVAEQRSTLVETGRAPSSSTGGGA